MKKADKLRYLLISLIIEVACLILDLLFLYDNLDKALICDVALGICIILICFIVASFIFLIKLILED